MSTSQTIGTRAARALARSGLTVLRVPEDVPTLADAGLDPGEIELALRALQRRGLVERVGKNVYAVRDQAGTELSTFESLIAARLNGADHLVTGWWALARHQLTPHSVRQVVVLSPSKRSPVEYRGRRAKFAMVPLDDIWGGSTSTSGLSIARPERALLDSVGTRPCRIPIPRVAECMDAFLHSPDHDAQDRLVRAAVRFGSASATRRIGFLIELIAGRGAAEPLLDAIGTSRTPVPLDVGDQRRFVDQRWRVFTSLTPEAILEHRETR